MLLVSELQKESTTACAEMTKLQQKNENRRVYQVSLKKLSKNAITRKKTDKSPHLVHE